MIRKEAFSVPLLLTAILVLASGLRIAALMSMEKTPYFNIFLNDENYYHSWAVEIAEGSFKSNDVYEFPPLPAYFMAGIYKVFSPNHVYIRLANIIMGTLTCYFIFLIAKELAGRSAGLWACLISALYGPFILYNIVILKTTLSVFLFSVLVYLLLWSVRFERWFKPILVGICLGLLINIRGNYIVLIPLMALLMFLRSPFGRSRLKQMVSRLLLFLVGLCLAVLPFVLRNYVVSGEFVLTTSQAGLNLYLGNNFYNKLPYYRPVPFSTSNPRRQGKEFTIEAARRTGQTLSASEASSFWTKQVLLDSLERPGYYSLKIILKTMVLLNRFEAGDHYHSGFLCRFAHFFRFPWLAYWMILPFGLLGLFISVNLSRSHLYTTLVFLFYAGTLVLFFSNARYRLPLMVILIPYAVMGLKEMAKRFRRKERNNFFLHLALLMVIYLIVFLPLPGTDDVSGYYNTHAVLLNRIGRKDEAIQYWQKSSEMNKSYSVYANLSLAQKSYEMDRDLEKSLHYLNKIDESSFAASIKYLQIGDVMLLSGKTDLAIEAYRKSLQINFGQKEARLKLIKIYRKTDKKKAAEEIKEYQRIEGDVMR